MKHAKSRVARMLLLFAVCTLLAHTLIAQSPAPPPRNVSPGSYAVTVEK